MALFKDGTFQGTFQGPLFKDLFKEALFKELVCFKRLERPLFHCAVTRTVPFILTIYALVVLWYFGNGCTQADVDRARRLSPWYRDKLEPSFGDMLAALRRHLWTEQNFSAPSHGQGSSKINAALLDWLCAA